MSTCILSPLNAASQLSPTCSPTHQQTWVKAIYQTGTSHSTRCSCVESPLLNWNHWSWSFRAAKLVAGTWRIATWDTRPKKLLQLRCCWDKNVASVKKKQSDEYIYIYRHVYIYCIYLYIDMPLCLLFCLFSHSNFLCFINELLHVCNTGAINGLPCG